MKESTAETLVDVRPENAANQNPDSAVEALGGAVPALQEPAEPQPEPNEKNPKQEEQIPENKQDPNEKLQAWECPKCKILNNIDDTFSNQGDCINKANGSGFCSFNQDQGQVELFDILKEITFGEFEAAVMKWQQNYAAAYCEAL